MSEEQKSPGQQLIGEVSAFVESAGKKTLTALEEVGLWTWHVLKAAIEKEAPQLPNLVIQGVVAAASAPAGANKKDIAAKTILSGLEKTGIQSAESAVTDNLGAVATATGIDANTLDNFITSTVGALRTKGIIQ